MTEEGKVEMGGYSPNHGPKSQDHLEAQQGRGIDDGLVGREVQARHQLAAVDEDSDAGDDSVERAVVAGLPVTKPPEADEAEEERGQGRELP